MKISQLKEFKANLNELNREPPNDKKTVAPFLFDFISYFFKMYNFLLHTNLHLNADLRVRGQIHTKVIAERIVEFADLY